MNTLEVIAHTIDDVKNIDQSKATRIELCTNMMNDGLTPPLQLIENAVSLTDIPIMVMVRNHHANFVYDDKDFAHMLRQIDKLTSMGVHGIVIGCLTKTNKINYAQMKKVKTAAKNLEITFHRAFDWIKEEEKVEAAKKLKKIGIDRVMTIGDPNQNITDNWSILTKINEEIELLAGGGVNHSNAKLLSKRGIKHFHVGTSVRDKKSWQGHIIPKKINKIYNKIN